MSNDYDTTNAALTAMLGRYKAGIDYFVCSNVPNNPMHNVQTSPRQLRIPTTPKITNQGWLNCRVVGGVVQRVCYT